jgi:hypothetical protein
MHRVQAPEDTFGGCYECNKMNDQVFQAPLFDYGRCDKIPFAFYGSYDNKVMLQRIPQGLHFGEVNKICKDVHEYLNGNVTPNNEETWGNHWHNLMKTSRITKVNLTTGIPRFNARPWFYENIVDDYTNPNPMYNHSDGTSHWYTMCNGIIEINSTWMQTNPTWEYDLNACMNWLPYGAL